MYEQKIRQEQRFEQEQNPQSRGKKILWIVGPGKESKIGGNLPHVLESAGIHGKRIIYNNLRSDDEFPGWENSHNRTETDLVRQAEELCAGDCYVLDYLQLFQPSTDMVTSLSLGKVLFHQAASRGADCLILCIREKIPQKTVFFDWQQLLVNDADIVLLDDFKERI